MTPMKTLVALVAAALSGVLSCSAQRELAVTRLHCEQRVAPEGIDEIHPRLSWNLSADVARRGVRQTAYQILVASSPELLRADKGDLWDTGRIDSSRMLHVVYAGLPLGSGQECWWKVRAWDDRGAVSNWSKASRWSMGLLSTSDWQARWIGFDSVPSAAASALSAADREAIASQRWVYADVPIVQERPQRAWMRGTFAIDGNERLSKVMLALTVDQLCTVTLNGRVVAEVSRWQQLDGIDVTSFTLDGENVLGLEVVQFDGHPPAALGAVILASASGEERRLPIDTSWKFSLGAAAGWDRPGFAAADWPALVDPPMKRNPWDGPPQTFTYSLPPAVQLRKSFELTKPVRRAVIHSTALGAYELYANGARVGRDVLAPGWTDFNARVQYQTYDVTGQLRKGINVLGAVLGDGWYASVLGYTGKRYFYGGYPRFMAQLEVEYTDGTKVRIPTDETWLASDGGPIRSADLMQGCVYDARLEDRGWAAAAAPSGQWKPVAVGLRPVAPGKALKPFLVEAAKADASRVIQELQPRTVSEPRPGAFTYDLGQNMVGWVRLKVKGRPGQKVMVRHGEMLNPNGTLYTSNLRGANATDVYFLRGDESEVLEPHFTFHGFRYLEITGLDVAPAPSDVTGMVVHSAMEQTGEFECSNPLVNRLFQNVVWGQKGNYVEVPTDCPQRDERAGWSGDAQFFIGTAVYNFDVAAFFSRWMTTLAVDSQSAEGGVANVAPAFGALWASPGWGGDAVLICVHELHRVYGDTRLIERNYDSMARYLEWLSNGKKSDTIRARELGDHLNLGGGAALPVISRAYEAHLNQLMSEMAAAIGRTADAEGYAAKSQRLKDSFRGDFVRADGSLADSSQTGYALAFSMGLLDENAKPAAAAKFAEELDRFGGHLATGFIGTPRLLSALRLAGREDLANALLLKETFPSWLFQVKNGATTVWERWDGWTPQKGFQTIAMNSFNHYAFGSVGEYLYRSVAGINPDAPGFARIEIRPLVGRGLDWARASYTSASGLVRSAWRVDEGELTMDVEIPANTEATIFVPTMAADKVLEGGRPATLSPGVKLVRVENDAVIYQVGSGRYHFTAR